MDIISEVLAALFAPMTFFYLMIGVLGGIIIGSLPGLTATMALAVMLPFTFSMAPDVALVTLGGIYVGAIFGGCIAAILINTPGTPSSIATAFDGYPMAQKGKAEQALITASIGSGIGGVFGGIALLFLSPLLAHVALQFGPSEFFWIAVLGLTLVATLSQGSLLKGALGASFGLLLSTVGISILGGSSRFTFGSSSLQGGLEIIVLLIAFFCIPQVMRMIKGMDSEKEEMSKIKSEKAHIFTVFKSMIMRPILLLRSALIGITVGLIPGAGGNVASLLSYDAAVRFSKQNKLFGKGDERGVAASETANNAEVGGSLVPLLSLGIPGGPPSAVLIGALLIQGIQPGPNLFTSNATLIYTFIGGFIIANILMLIFAIFGSKYIGKIIQIPIYYLVPTIVFLTMIGAFAIRNNFMDIIVLALFGLAAYMMSERGFSPAPIVLGIILGPIAEKGIIQAYLISEGFPGLLSLFFSRPLTVGIMTLCFLSLFSPLITKLVTKRSTNA
ncbi:tripartite tricarboxylate transporter permease [Oceanobacillus sp. FSL W7-1281]|uniref:tripartite tricarboxylate transporter permease n=1 Tax=Oceanobacillus sp. FSL W7-1281 TaxID=2921698 RepID=UPI0030DB6934